MPCTVTLARDSLEGPIEKRNPDYSNIGVFVNQQDTIPRQPLALLSVARVPGLKSAQGKAKRMSSSKDGVSKILSTVQILIEGTTR